MPDKDNMLPFRLNPEPVEPTSGIPELPVSAVVPVSVIMTRVSIAIPDHALIVIEAPSVAVLCAPMLDVPTEVMCTLDVPSGVHMTALAASFIAHLRRQYGDVAVRQALEASETFQVHPSTMASLETKPGPKPGPKPPGGPLG
jgi:hypothetical protein